MRSRSGSRSRSIDQGGNKQALALALAFALALALLALAPADGVPVGWNREARGIARASPAKSAARLGRSLFGRSPPPPASLP